MNCKSLIVLAISTIVFLGGCGQGADKFDVIRAGNQTFVLNKNNGDVQLVDGVSLVKVKAPESADDRSSKQAKKWPNQVIPQLDNLKLEIQTKYRDGRMMYVIVATPFDGILGKEYAGSGSNYLREPAIYIDFSDEDGFPTGDAIQLKIRGGGSTRVVNPKGEVYALSWTGSQVMTLDAYRASTTQSVRWAAFTKE